MVHYAWADYAWAEVNCQLLNEPICLLCGIISPLKMCMPLKFPLRTKCLKIRGPEFELDLG